MRTFTLHRNGSTDKSYGDILAHVPNLHSTRGDLAEIDLILPLRQRAAASGGGGDDPNLQYLMT